MGARLGQHFLVDESVRDAIIRYSGISATDLVLEIGPGKGVLTAALLQSAAKVVAVEMDERLAEALPAHARLRLIRADFLKLNLDELGAGPFKIVANLPYSVATPILQKILSWSAWTSAILMFQKEVAARITAKPGGADYGLLTLSVAIHAAADEVLEVPRECFSPRPQVASTVVHLRKLPKPLLDPGLEEVFFRVAKAAFTQRRKMAAGPIAATLRLPRARVVEALGRLGVDAASRAERIPIKAYLNLPAELGLRN